MSHTHKEIRLKKCRGWGSGQKQDWLHVLIHVTHMKSRFKPWQKLKTRNSILFHGSCRGTTAQASQLKRQGGSTSVTSYLISPSPPVSDTERELHSFCFITQKGPLLLPVEMEGGGLLVRSVCPRADMMLTAEKPLQTTAQMCFIWLYLLTHPVCIACEDSIKQRHRTDCRPPNFPSALLSYMHHST